MTISPATIFALSSGRPPAAIAVVRISGPRAGDALKALAGRMPEPRHAMFARVRDPRSGDQIDEALALWFPGPASETGEDMAELQLHGGRAVIAAVFEALSQMEGLRPAEAGEFTRRAFENGKLDLTRVEGLADLISADTEAQRRQALRQLQGLLGKKAEEWRRRLIEALALVEAQIDFSDEEDVQETLAAKAVHVAREVLEEIGKSLKSSTRGERLREGLFVAIAGPPNAGKSSLLNALARRDAAIVSPVPGTTRDVIEVHLDPGGYPVTLVDTAGIRDSADPIEQEGVRRAKARAAEADLVLWVVDATVEAGSAMKTIETASQRASVETWVIENKADLLDNNQDSRLSNLDYRCYFISATAGTGLPRLLEALRSFASAYFGDTETSLITRARQRTGITELSVILVRIIAQRSPDHADDLEFLAEDLRLAVRTIGRLTGRIDVEEVLDVIFRDFCIGK
ncbi:MAG: tRNA uridine-5-carboxymethylaminomethyl(34) synthesis GTPase MnmE [Candidatus Binataceae bacterium]